MAKHHHRKENVIDLLQEHGIYPTQQRIEIASIMLAESQHLSAEQVLLRVNAGGRAAVSKATVYNTLGLFAEKGLVRQLVVDPSKVFYDSNTGPHHHFFNVDSGELTDIAGQDISIGHLPDLPGHTEIDGVDVIIRVRNTS